MRQPVRDERWTDPQGQEWQVLEIGKWRTGTTKSKKHFEGRAMPAGRFTVAYVVMRSLDGRERKVSYSDLLASWSPAQTPDGGREGDPLAGHRSRVAKDLRDGKGILIFQGECPVRKGELFHVGGVQIVIEKVAVKVNKRSERVFEVHLLQRATDRVYLLRQTVPAARPGELVGDGATAEDAERARIDGNYTSSAAQSDAADGGTDAGEAVPPGWIDKGTAARELHRQRAQRQTQNERQIQAAKSRINRLLKTADPGKVESILADLDALCGRAESEELGKVA